MFKNNVFNPRVDTIKWAKSAAVRAIKTMAQSALAMIPVAAMIQNVDWISVAGTAALAGVVSVLMSLAGLPEVKDGE